MNLLWLIPICFGVIWLGAIPVFIISDRRAYNKGVCRSCAGHLRHASTDSQGGKLWICEDCSKGFWTSWIRGGGSIEGEWNAMRKVVDSYRAAEERGLLVRLPCKLGDTVYVEWSGGREYSKSVVEKISIGTNGQARFLIPAYLHSHSASWYQTSDFGKTVFLTREEAEAALKGETEDV